MIGFSKLVSWAFLPPGLLVLMAGLALLLLLLGQRGRASLVLSVTVFLFYLLSIEPFGNMLLAPLEERYPHPQVEKPRCEAIAVLGGGVVGGSPDKGGGASPEAQTVKRTLAAYRVWKQRPVPIVVSGGAVFATGGASAEAMAVLLEELGVPPEFIIRETDSRNTYQNGKNIQAIMKEWPWGSICVVTSAFHLPRAVAVFDKLDINTVPLPADYHVQRGPGSLRGMLPSIQAFHNSATALHEYFGMIYYKLVYGV